MNSRSLTFAAGTSALLLTFPSAYADITNIVRPDYQNLTAATGAVQSVNPTVVHIQGLITPVATAPSDGAVRLTEASFGQPLARWIPSSDFQSTQSYAARIVSEVRAVLYPPSGANRTAVETSGAAFRYKYLLFSTTPGESDVTSQFDSIDAWFTAADKAVVNAQIIKLRDAIANAPLDNSLRDLLLECYYDLAVAGMQGAKKKLAALATKRLGFEIVSPFIIDEEISTYEQLVTQVEGVLAKYAELLSVTVDGVDPADFDESVARGMPMGYYVFIKQQPNRNATPTQFVSSVITLTFGSTTVGTPDVTVATTDGLAIGMPITGTGIPADTKVESITGATTFTLSQNATATTTGQTFSAGGAMTVPDYDRATGSVVPRPENQVLFSGYKDYVTYLRIMADYVRYQAELARLRGMRQGPNDVTKGRNALAKIMRETALDFVLLRGLYPASQFPPGDASGANAAINGVETAMADVTNVRGFLNGTTNVLGLDPNFLLLVQESTIGGTRYFDSFDILRQRLKGSNQPLTVALEKKTEAEGRYNNFRASVDKVVQELDDVDANFADRYFDITGYTPTETPGFTGTAKPGSGSELDIVQQSIESLHRRTGTLSSLNNEIGEDLSLANTAVKAAEGIGQAVENAGQTYRNETDEAWAAIHAEKAIAAGAQAAAEGVYAVGGADLGYEISSGLAAAANAIVQAQAAAVISHKEQKIERAALAMETTLQKADSALVVNQARQELGAIKREQHAHTLETEDNNTALAQAIAQKTALLNEVQRILAKRSENTVAVRSKFYADPIHYIRAENALIEADESFRDAQRWLFYTLKALEYKWQQRFAKTIGSRQYDTGAIFKLRNASELDDLLTAMVIWDGTRAGEDIPGEGTTFISFKDHVLAPNPGNLRLTNTADTGTRVDFLTGETVTQTELFRRKLLQSTDGARYIRIPFDTMLLEDLNGNFFRGPDYLLDGTVIPGKWRDKIAYVKVNIIGEDGTPIPGTRLGSLTYGGNTFTRTRIPPCGNRLTAINAPISPEARDIPSEFSVSPFRFYNSVNYNDVFVSADTQGTSIDMAYTGATARSPTGEEILGATFQINAFNQRSVAATRWILTINPDEVDISKLKDIEIIVKHRFSDRVAPICP